MAGLALDMGLGGSVFAGGGYPGAATPAASVPTAQGPSSIGQKAFGVVTGDEGTHPLGFWSSTLGGALALGLLAFIWWSLPR